MGATQQFTATAKDSNGNTMTGVTFTWASSSTSVATINSSGLATAAGAGTTQITASASGVTSAADTLTVTAPTVASVTVSPSSPSIAVNGTQQFTATAKDSGGNTLSGITFTWASSATNVATINSSGVATGVSAGTTQITASANGVTSSNDTLTVTAPSACTLGGSESLLNGGYAFLLKGFDASGNPALVVGALTFDGAGTITAGSLDENLNSGVESNISINSGCYQIGSDQRGLMVVTNSNSQTQNYRFSVGGISGGVASTGHMIDFDSSGPFTTGILRKQSGGPFTNASLNGSYAFGGSSLQNAAVCTAPCKLGIAGAINFDGSGLVTGGAEDINVNGTLDGNASNTTWPASPIPIDSGGTYSVSANGRTTLAISFGGGSSSANTVLYIISPSEAFFMKTDPQTTAKINAGSAMLQSGTPFAANPLSGTYIGYDSGIGPINGGTQQGGGRTDLYLVGPMTAGNNTINGVQYRNNGGTFSSGGLAGNTYSSVAASGRSVISGGGGHAPVIYLVSNSQFFFLSSDLGVDDGFFELQTGGPFSTSSASGTYAIGFIDPELSTIGAVSGLATLTPASNSINLILDGNVSGTPVSGQTQNNTYSIDSTGLGLEPLGCSIASTPPTCDSALYVISPTKAVSMDLQSSNPTIVTADK